MNRLKAPSPGLAFGRPALKSGKKRGGGPSLIMPPHSFPLAFPNPFTHYNHDRLQLQRTPLPPSARPIPAPAPFRASAGRVCEQPAAEEGGEKAKPAGRRTHDEVRPCACCVVLCCVACLLMHRRARGSVVYQPPSSEQRQRCWPLAWSFCRPESTNAPSHVTTPPVATEHTDRGGEAVRGFDWRSQS